MLLNPYISSLKNNVLPDPESAQFCMQPNSYPANIFSRNINVVCLLCLLHVSKCTPILLQRANTMNPDQTAPNDLGHIVINIGNQST